MPPRTSDLTALEAAFVREYLVDLCGAEAVRRSGSKAKHPNTLANQMMKRPHIKAAIDAAMAARAERTEITQDRVLNELALIAFGDLADFVEWGPGGVRMREGADLDPDKRRALAEVAETVTKEGGSQRVKMHDKLGALTLIGKHLGIFKEQVEHTGKDGGPIKHEHALAPQSLDILSKLVGGDS